MEGGSVVILVGSVILLIYIIFVFICYQQKKFIFSPYKQPKLENGFQPNGKVTKLTPIEKMNRANRILGN
ncbi:MAG: hypothetical protein COA94_02795 [Rickettsiales bacterium]|nr:MAG: hypothetical protein COA94_02795 [Rickettsiales bacterium]